MYRFYDHAKVCTIFKKRGNILENSILRTEFRQSELISHNDTNISKLLLLFFNLLLFT